MGSCLVRHRLRHSFFIVWFVASVLFAIFAVSVCTSSAWADDIKSITFKSGQQARIYAGSDRYETCGLIDSDYNRYSDGDISGIVVCSGNVWSDALCAESIASSSFPLVLVDGSADNLDKNTVGILDKLVKNCGGSTNIFVVGGSRSVSSGIYSDLCKYDVNSNPVRLSGDDRYATSEEIYSYILTLGGEYGLLSNNWFDTVVVSGENFPDALSVGSYCGSRHHPVLLFNPDDDGQLIKDVFETYGKWAISPTCLIVGGESSVSASFENWVGANNYWTFDRRISGADRYETNINFISWAVGKGYLDNQYIGVASGTNFPDALSSNSLLANDKACGSPLVLVNQNDIYYAAGAEDYLYERSSEINNIFLFGGIIDGTTQNHVIPAALGFKIELRGSMTHGSYTSGFIVNDDGTVYGEAYILCDYAYIPNENIYVNSPTRKRTYLGISNSIFLWGAPSRYEYSYEFEFNFDDKGIYTVTFQGTSVDNSLKPSAYYVSNYYSRFGFSDNNDIIKATSIENIEPNIDGSWTCTYKMTPQDGYYIKKMAAGWCDDTKDSVTIDTYDWNYGSWTFDYRNVSDQSRSITFSIPYGVPADDNAYLVCAWCEKIGSSSASFPIFSGGLDCAEVG